MASNMTKIADENMHSASHARGDDFVSEGHSTIMAVEVARRAVPGHVSSSFQELEKKGPAAETANPWQTPQLQVSQHEHHRPIIIIIKKKSVTVDTTRRMESCLCDLVTA